MKFQITKDPMSMLEIDMNKGESIRADGGSFVFKIGNFDIKTHTREGFLKNLKVSILGQESFFINDFNAMGDSCKLGLSGPPVGDIIEIPITAEQGFIIQSGTYVASTSSVDLDTKWQGFSKGIFGTELFMLKATGKGSVFVNAYGGIIKKELESGETMTLDNYHLVALSNNSHYVVTKFGGIKSTLFSGEGLVTEITGPAIVYFQTKNLKELMDLISGEHAKDNSSNTHTMAQAAMLGLRFASGFK